MPETQLTGNGSSDRFPLKPTGKNNIATGENGTGENATGQQYFRFSYKKLEV